MIAAVSFDLLPELLAMLTNSLIPFSFERGGELAGAATALGFCLSVMHS